MKTPRSRMTVGGKLSFRGRVQQSGPSAAPALLVLGGENPPPLGELVPVEWRDAPIEVEVGSGKGAFLTAATSARPTSFWLGIEAAISYAELSAMRLAEAGRENVRVLVDNASLFVRDRCEPASVSRLHVYFPDPWPKRRHRGRRFFRATPPEVLRRVLTDDGVLLVASDNAALIGEVVRIIGASPLFARDRALEDQLRELPGQGFSPTNFERKYLAEGRIVRRFAWRVQPLPRAAT